MGYVVRLKRNQLVGGNNNDEIYPITSTNAVYRGGKNLEDILDELGRDVDSKKVTEVSYNESTNSIKVTYSNGDISNYTLTDCVKNVSFNNSILTFTKTDGTETSITIQKPNNGTLSLKKGSTVVNFTADSSEDKTVNIPNIYIEATGNEFPNKGIGLNVDGTHVDFPKIIMVPTFGVDKGTYLAEATNLKNAIRSRNLNGLSADNDICVYDFIDDGGKRTAVMYPRLPKLVAAVSLSGNNLVITYLEDKVGSSQSETTIPLIEDKDATLNYSQRTTIATVGGVDVHVTLPDKPTYDIKTEFYDISVSNELEFFRAVAVSWGYPINSISNITNCNNTSLVTSLYSGSTPVNVRIHITADITLSNCHTYNLQYCQTINGNSFKISFNDTITIQGRGCNFEKVKFSFNSNNGKYAFLMDSDLNAHSKYYFNMCQFAGCMMYPQSGNSTGFIKFTSKNNATSNSLYLTACSFNANNNINTNDKATSSSIVNIEWLGPIGAAFVYIISNVSLPYNKGSQTNTNKFKIIGTSNYPSSGGTAIYSTSADVSYTGFTNFDLIQS